MGENDKVRWSRVVWNRLSIPKCIFIMSQLRTSLRQKLSSTWNRSSQMHFVLDVVHILKLWITFFFACHLSSQCLTELLLWLRCRFKIRNNVQLYPHTWGTTNSRKKLVFAVLACLVHKLWLARNDAVWRGFLPAMKIIVQLVKTDSNLRCKALWQTPVCALVLQFLLYSLFWFHFCLVSSPAVCT